MQIIPYSIGLSIGLVISAILLISVTTRKKRSTRNKLIRVIVANTIVAAVLLFLYPYHIQGVADTPVLGVFPILLTLLLDAIALNRIFSGERPDQEILNTWHDDPANWRFKIFYYNPKDHRLFPPKRIEGFGWTINFANIYSILVMVVILVLLAVLINYWDTIHS